MNPKYLAAQIWSEFVEVEGLKVRQNSTWQEILKCQTYRAEQLSLYRFEPFLEYSQACKRVGLPDDVEETLKRLNSTVDNTKMAIFQNFSNLDLINKNKKILKRHRSSIEKLEALKFKASSYTLEGFLDQLEERFELGLRIHGKCEDIRKVQAAILSNMCSLSDLRATARSPWYQKQKDNIDMVAFNDGPLTGLQTFLVSWAELYSSLGEIDDRPAPDIIDDDDAFDGWLLVRKANKTDPSSNKVNPKHNQAQEQFNFVSSKEAANRVALSNTGNAKAQQEARMKTIASKQVFSLSNSK